MTQPLHLPGSHVAELPAYRLFAVSVDSLRYLPLTQRDWAKPVEDYVGRLKLRKNAKAKASPGTMSVPSPLETARTARAAATYPPRALSSVALSKIPAGTVVSLQRRGLRFYDDYVPLTTIFNTSRVP